jgi:flagellar biogenesis protein FliO
MTSARHHERVVREIGVALILGPLFFWLVAPSVRADQGPPTASITGRDAVSRPFPPRGAAGRRAAGLAEKSDGWWFGTAGIALALALFGGISMASRRLLPRAGSGGLLGVVGRASLSPKHTVYLLRVGERVLILGTGPQGSPTLLGELPGPDDLPRFAPRRQGPTDPAPPEPEPEPGRSVRGFDRPAGEDE